MSETITLDGTEFVYRKGKWYEQSAEEDTPAGGWMIVPDSLFFRALDALATETARREKAEAYANDWIRAVMYATMPHEFGIAFVPTNPMAWAESRRHAVDLLLTERDSLRAQLKEAQRAGLEWPPSASPPPHGTPCPVT